MKKINYYVPNDKVSSTKKPAASGSKSAIIKKKTKIIYDPSVKEVSEDVVRSYHDAKSFLEEHDIKISTITLDCKLHTKINVERFAKYVPLTETGILSVKFGDPDNTKTNRTIIFIKSKKKPSKRNFYNQVTIRMRPMNNPSRNPINIKVFKNGSLQMTGCKDMDDYHNVTNTLIEILKSGVKIKRDNRTIKGRLAENPEEIGIFDTKIRMINSNFKVDYNIDRKKLAELLRINHGFGSNDEEFGYIQSKYKPAGGHSCVNIKHYYDEHNHPSVFVFQTGSIIITGAKNYYHIISAYKFIIKVLERYHTAVRIPILDMEKIQLEIARFKRIKDLRKRTTK
jgi:TATA-box binding protein (TBP) (component of TFIID and TFIIIB)